VIEYIQKHRDEVEAEYQLVLKQAAERERDWREHKGVNLETKWK
jgi:hypothetical protein